MPHSAMRNVTVKSLDFSRFHMTQDELSEIISKCGGSDNEQLDVSSLAHKIRRMYAALGSVVFTKVVRFLMLRALNLCVHPTALLTDLDKLFRPDSSPGLTGFSSDQVLLA